MHPNKYIYEYLVNNVQYVEEAPDNQNIYSALVGKATVCAGYAKANQYLLNRMGIYCTYVIGTAALEEEFRCQEIWISKDAPLLICVRAH